MGTEPEYSGFADLPRWVRQPVQLIRNGDEEQFVWCPVPALGQQCIMNLMNQGEEGQNRVRSYLNAAVGKIT